MSDWREFQMGRASNGGWFRVLYWTKEPQAAPSAREVQRLVEQLQLTAAFLLEDLSVREMEAGDLFCEARESLQ